MFRALFDMIYEWSSVNISRRTSMKSLAIPRLLLFVSSCFFMSLSWLLVRASICSSMASFTFTTAKLNALAVLSKKLVCHRKYFFHTSWKIISSSKAYNANIPRQNEVAYQSTCNDLRLPSVASVHNYWDIWSIVLKGQHITFKLPLLSSLIFWLNKNYMLSTNLLLSF